MMYVPVESALKEMLVLSPTWAIVVPCNFTQFDVNTALPDAVWK
jgi:hypothetical protein